MTAKTTETCRELGCSSSFHKAYCPKFKDGPKLHVVEPELKLDLGAGQTPQPDFEGVDLHAPNAKHRVDLWSGERWPWADSSVSELFSSHTIEHIEKGNRWKTYSGQGNLFYFFFEECWRIIKPGGTFKLQWPALQNVRSFQDPGHCDFIPLQRMMYLDRNWREMNKLEHYTTKACDFVMESGTPTTSLENSKRADAVQQRMYVECWGFSDDFIVTLRARKPA